MTACSVLAGLVGACRGSDAGATADGAVANGGSGGAGGPAGAGGGTVSSYGGAGGARTGGSSGTGGAVGADGGEARDAAADVAKSDGAAPRDAAADVAKGDGSDGAEARDTVADGGVARDTAADVGATRDSAADVAKSDGKSVNIGTDATYPNPTGKPTVYLAGDSTVQTYSASQAPQQGWGQRIHELFTNDVAFVNKSIGGRSSKSFIDEGRLTDILGSLKEGDYLFAQWGINDRYRSDPDRYTDPATTFRTYLKQYIDGARGKNAIPVLITPTPRLDYSNGAFQNGFPDYCAAILAVGRETNTPVIDLQTMGLALYTSLGYDAVVATIALPGPDVLHFRDTGAYQMARLVAQGVSEIGLPISPYVLKDKLVAP